jgi:hypothetical protein
MFVSVSGSGPTFVVHQRRDYESASCRVRIATSLSSSGRAFELNVGLVRQELAGRWPFLLELERRSGKVRLLAW